jgi:hypothetical protein
MEAFSSSSFQQSPPRDEEYATTDVGDDAQVDINNNGGHNYGLRRGALKILGCVAAVVVVTLAISNGIYGITGNSVNPETFAESSEIGDNLGPPLGQNSGSSPSMLGNAPAGGGPSGITVKAVTTTKAPTALPTAAPAPPSEPPTLAPTVGLSTGVKFTTRRDGYPTLEYFGLAPSSFLNYKILEGHAGVVEPNADMYLHIFDIENKHSRRLESDLSTQDPIKFTLCANDDSGCKDYNYEDSFNLACTPRTTVYSVSISRQSESGWDVAGTGYLKCMYVRRELRSLTEKDLDATVSAMYQMWELEEDEGQAKYGPNFHNYARLLEYHYFNAAWQDADHVHEGNGFLPQHMKMDLIFSRSLAAIDPSISLMYWDFTM